MLKNVLQLEASAFAFYCEGDLVAALESYARIVHMRTFIAGNFHPSLIAPLIKIGLIHRRRGEFRSAEHTYKRAREIAGRAGFPLEVARCNNYLAGLYWIEKRHDECLDLIEDSRCIYVREGRADFANLCEISAELLFAPLKANQKEREQKEVASQSANVELLPETAKYLGCLAPLAANALSLVRSGLIGGEDLLRLLLIINDGEVWDTDSSTVVINRHFEKATGVNKIGSSSQAVRSSGAGTGDDSCKCEDALTRAIALFGAGNLCSAASELAQVCRCPCGFAKRQPDKIQRYLLAAFAFLRQAEIPASERNSRASMNAFLPANPVGSTGMKS